MKKFLLSICSVMLACSAFAQGVGPSENVILGKKWYVAERYADALPYLEKAVEEGDPDSKAYLATMIFTMQVPEYSMDRDYAMHLLDQAIEQGSIVAIERKGFCTLLMGDDTKEAKQAGVDLLQRASEMGNADASFGLYRVYNEGVRSYATREFYIAPDSEKALTYIKLAAEQGGLEGKAYVGMYTYEGSHGFTQDKAAGVKLMEQALAQDSDGRIFAGNCVEPAKTLITYYKANGMTAKATPLEKLIKKFHIQER